MQRLVIGISGASGFIYGLRALQLLRSLPDASRPEIHLVMTDAAELTLAYETSWKLAEVHKLADVVHDNRDLAAPLASGSFKTLGMLIAPASMRSCAAIATSLTDNLLSRAADVALKEKRRLVLMARETPLHLGHLRTLTQLAEMGAVIAPPLPAFYARPKDLGELVDHSVARALDLFGIDVEKAKRWGPGDKRRPLPGETYEV